MPLINTDGLTIIGDGSQWFWAMAGFFAIPVTGFLIFSQLRGQRSASAVAQVEAFNREGMTEQMNRHVVELLIALRDHKDPTDLPRAATAMIAGFWETFAGLARAGHRDPKLLWRMNPTAAQTVWAWLAPWVRWRRAETGRGDDFSDLEWLAGLMADMDRRAGNPPVTPAFVAMVTESHLAIRRQLLRDAEAMRTVYVAAPEAVTAAQQPVAAARRPRKGARVVQPVSSPR